MAQTDERYNEQVLDYELALCEADERGELDRGDEELEDDLDFLRCTSCGSRFRAAEAKRDEGYVYCPACVAADPELQ